METFNHFFAPDQQNPWQTQQSSTTEENWCVVELGSW